MDFVEAKAVFAEARQKLPFMKDADWGRPMLPVQLRFAELARLDVRVHRMRLRATAVGFELVDGARQDPVHGAGFLMPLASILTWLERRQSAMMQDRLGPNRANIGPFKAWGIMHFLADAVKIIFKEDFVPGKAHRFLFMLAPIMAMAPALIVARDHPVRPDAVLGDQLTRRRSARQRLRPAGRRCRSLASTSACCSTSRSRRWRSTARRWPGGRRTTSGR